MHKATRHGWLVTITSLALLSAGPRNGSPAHPAVPFRVGEELVYEAHFARLSAGSARMWVAGVDMVRGRPAYHLVFTLDGGIVFYRVHDRFESWMDTVSLVSLRYRERISEGPYHRASDTEIYPELASYSKNGAALRPSVTQPLDDGSFIYAVRIIDVRPGDSLSVNRYFVANLNPVTIVGIRRDDVVVPAGRFAAIQVHPTIKTNGIFSDRGDARVWFSDDAQRYPIQLIARFAIFHLTLALDSIVHAPPASVPP